MTLEVFAEQLSQNIQRQLPGAKAHQRLLPKSRLLVARSENSEVKSAVLLIVGVRDGCPWLLFIKRSQYQGYHSGQIAFPGGKFDSTLDRNLIETAIRETREEIGIMIDQSNIIGGLTPLFIPVSKITVYPFVAVVSNIAGIFPNRREVDEVFSTPIATFNESNIKTGNFRGDNYALEAPYWEVNRHKIWGATAMILSEFLEILPR